MTQTAMAFVTKTKFSVTVEAACNYNPAATDNDGSCAQNDECGVCGGTGILQAIAIVMETSSTPWVWWSMYDDADADGICDDADDCVGSLDACGVCNGPGAFTPADALTFPQAIVIATATCSTLVAFAVAQVWMRMPMAFVTTLMSASVNSMSAVFATGTAALVLILVLQLERQAHTA